MAVEPVAVPYCPNCSLPYEFCEFNSKDMWEKCVPHIRKNAPGMYPDKIPAASGEEVAAEMEKLEMKEEEKKEEKKDKGGKKKKKETGIVVEKSTRNKRKAITTIKGLDMFGVKLAEASKAFGKKFACGSSVTKDASQKEQIDVQGDFAFEIAEFIIEKFAKGTEMTEKDITVVEDGKKHKLG